MKFTTQSLDSLTALKQENTTQIRKSTKTMPASKITAAQMRRVFPQAPCPKCYAGSCKLAGHVGRHVTKPASKITAAQNFKIFGAQPKKVKTKPKTKKNSKGGKKKGKLVLDRKVTMVRNYYTVKN